MKCGLRYPSLYVLVISVEAGLLSLVHRPLWHACVFV
uniref:Uncharacterized protein n=1 Tax=Rhizophora mucronata TaxID=61149 RepID=A0A2P2PAV6_RHIMU